MRATIGGSESGGADDRWHSLWRPGTGGSTGDRGNRRKARFGSVARSHGEHHGGQRAVGRSGGPRTGSAAAVSGGDRWIQPPSPPGTPPFPTHIPRPPFPK